MSDSAAPWTAARQASLSITNSRSLLKLMSIKSVTLSNHLILCCPLLPPSVFPSFRVFSRASSLHQVAKVLEFQLQHQSCQWIFRTDFLYDWLDLLAVQGALKSLLQQHSSKASILWQSALFIVQLSHPHMTIGKTIALTRWTFAGKVMSLLFNMLSWPSPSEQDPDSPTVSLSHQEVSTSLLSLSIRGQTEWKPQSQPNSLHLH